MRSHLGLGPMAREMKGSCLIAFSCSRFRSSACKQRRVPECLQNMLQAQLCSEVE